MGRAINRRKEYILSLYYGKDSLACLGAIEELDWPLDRIIHAEIWATDTIPADLPPMVSSPVIKCKKTPRKKCRFVADEKGKR